MNVIAPSPLLTKPTKEIHCSTDIMTSAMRLAARLQSMRNQEFSEENNPDSLSDPSSKKNRDRPDRETEDQIAAKKFRAADPEVAALGAFGTAVFDELMEWRKRWAARGEDTILLYLLL